MDLNELLHVQQIALMKADFTDDSAARRAHLDTVADVADRIAALRKSPVFSPYPADRLAAQPA